MIEAAVAELRAGRQVKVLDVAAAAGVSHSLIYRQFPDGGREELIAEAYARIFLSTSEQDLQTTRSLSDDPDELLEELAALYRTILSPEREEQRWSRLEALAQARRNPLVAQHLRAARNDLIDELVTDLANRPGWQFNQHTTRAFATLIHSLPLGLTAMIEHDISDEEIATIADVWARMVLAFTTTTSSVAPTSNAAVRPD